ncbi:MAG: hypothetical protein IB616_01650 [Methanosarcinales archaeon]|nr:MAG: hypothetical protein IB616_01650 [Methanosarcinales archaeon]
MRKGLMVFVTLAVVVTFLVGAGVGHMMHEPKKTTVTEFKYITEYQRHEIEQIAHDVATEREYEYGVYDCEEFSRELVRRLETRGYDAEYIAGYYGSADQHGPHTWDKVSIYIEATNGRIIPPEEFEKNYLIFTTLPR